MTNRISYKEVLAQVNKTRTTGVC